MKIWIDTEFDDRQELGGKLELISLGAVREDGEEFYAENLDFNFSTDITRPTARWLRANVMPHLTGPSLSARELANRFTTFCGNNPEFWGYYCAYDWVAVCNLYGGFMRLPEWWPHYIHEIQTIRILRNHKHWLAPEQTSTRHHALNDARYHKAMHDALMGDT